MKIVYYFVLVVIGISSHSVYGNEFNASFSGDLIQLEPDELASIVDNFNDIKDRQAVVVSLTGVYGKEKSLILNIFLRYLYAEYKKHDISDWLGENSTDRQVIDGFKRGNRDREPQGIVMWSEIFTFDFDNGEKVAIILLNTQEIFDRRSSAKQSTAILALSTLLSSVQIYNVMQNIEEDDLQRLHFFNEVTRITNGYPENKPFQKLLFLVRDWQFGDSEGYGSENGAKMIRETLAENGNPKMRELRKKINSTFDEVGAFLLPSPGPNLTRRNFHGELRQIDTKFLNFVKELTIELLDPENLLDKKINQRAVSIQNWFKYLEAYTEILNGKTTPNPQSVVEVTARVGEQILRDEEEVRRAEELVRRDEEEERRSEELVRRDEEAKRRADEQVRRDEEAIRVMEELVRREEEEKRRAEEQIRRDEEGERVMAELNRREKEKKRKMRQPIRRNEDE